jgi:UDP-glucose 4-epimerase
MTTPRTVFFTGGAGFIGMHVIPMLLDRGYRVRVFDNMFRGDRDAMAALTETGQVELIDQDVRYGGAVHAAMKGCESVIHFAAVSINKSQADPYESIDINMVGNHNVFAAAADHDVRRVVFASSASVYGEGQKTTAYYTSVINHFVNRLQRGEPPIIDGRGEQSMDFIHVHDIARATVMALEAEQDDLPVNVGTGIDTSIATLARILIDAVGADVEPQFNPRDVLVSRRAADTRRAREVLGFEPTITVEEGMTNLVKGSMP